MNKLMFGNIRDWGKVPFLMLDELAIIVVIILILHFVGVEITLPIMIVAGVVFVGFVFIRHVAVIPSFHKKVVTGREGMVGQQGQVVKPLTPVGSILIKGEYWRAEAIDGNIGTDENVEIVGVDGLTLMVKKKHEYAEEAKRINS